MRARPALRRLLVLSCVVLATGSVAATLEAQEEPPSGFSAPTAAVPTPDGAMLVADYGRCVIERIESSGARSVVAGKVDQCGAGPDGVPATESQLESPADAVPLQGGGFLVPSQGMNDCRIRKVDANGTISTVAGTGFCGIGRGDGGPATQADVTAIAAVPFNPPGQAVELPGEGFLITSPGDCDVRKVDGAGDIDTVAGNHTCAPVAQQSLDCAGSMCAAGLDFGLVSTTTNLTAPTPEWENEAVNVSGMTAKAMSCPSASFCATIDDEQVHASDAPTADDPSWNSEALAAESIGCASATLCLAGDTNSSGVWRSMDAAGDTPSWVLFPDVASDAADRVIALECVGANFCAAVTRFGEVATTTNASADPPVWNRDLVSGGLVAVSCPTAQLCVVAGGAGGLYVSTNPSAADPTWTSQSLVTNEVQDVSCPSADLCVAIDDAGHTLTSDDPDAAPSDSKWTERTIHPQHGAAELREIACGSESLCTVIESGAPEAAHFLVTSNPGAADPLWVPKPLDPGAQNGVSPTSQTLRTPIAAVPTADGGFLVTEVGAFSGPDAGQGSRVRKVSPDGDTIRTVAGTGVRGYSGDGGPATAAQLYQPTSAIPTPDGGFLVSEISNCVVRKVGSDGIIRRVAGVAPANPGSFENCGTQGTGGPATEAQLQRPTSAVTFPDGSVVIGSFGVANDPADRTAPLSRVLPSGTLVNALSPFVQPVGPGGENPGTQPPGGGITPTPAPACTVKAASSKVKGPKPKNRRKRRRAKKPGVLKTTVTCSQAAAVKVTAKLKVKPKKKRGKKRKRAKRYTLKAKTGNAQANTPLTLRLKVPKSALRKILKGAKGSVRLTLAATGAGGTDAATAKVKRLTVQRQT